MSDKEGIEGIVIDVTIRQLDAPLFQRAKILSLEENKTMGRIISEALELLLDGTSTIRGSAPKPPPISLASSTPIPKPKVFLNSDLVWDYMRRNNLKDGDMADKLGLARENLNKVLHHRYPTSADLGQRLIEVTGLTYDQLFNSAT